MASARVVSVAIKAASDIDRPKRIVRPLIVLTPRYALPSVGASPLPAPLSVRPVQRVRQYSARNQYINPK